MSVPGQTSILKYDAERALACLLSYAWSTYFVLPSYFEDAPKVSGIEAVHPFYDIPIGKSPLNISPLLSFRWSRVKTSVWWLGSPETSGRAYMKCSTVRRHRQRALGRTHTSTIHTAIGTVSLAASSRCVRNEVGYKYCPLYQYSRSRTQWPHSLTTRCPAVAGMVKLQYSRYTEYVPDFF